MKIGLRTAYFKSLHEELEETYEVVKCSEGFSDAVDIENCDTSPVFNVIIFLYSTTLLSILQRPDL